MTTVYAIDPGPVYSGWCALSVTNGDWKILNCGKAENSDLLSGVMYMQDSVLVIEKIASYGMPVGREVFDTCIWIGRFMQAYRNPEEVKLVYRKEVKLWLCGVANAKDTNIRQALIDKYPPLGDGKIPQIGTKKNPGPLYGVKKDAWAALALATTVIEMNL